MMLLDLEVCLLMIVVIHNFIWDDEWYADQHTEKEKIKNLINLNISNKYTAGGEKCQDY